MHDPRIGRFFAIDPLAGKYPHNSPYAFSENRVTNSVELEGLEAQDLTPSGGSINLPSGAKILKRYDNTSDGYVGPAVGAYGNYQGPVSAYGGGENETMFAVDGSVESFDYLGKTYKAVFSSGSGLFSGYESTDNLTEAGYTQSNPTIGYGSGKVILSQEWGTTAPSGEKAVELGMGANLTLGNSPAGWVSFGIVATGAVVLSSIELQSQTWNFELTDAPAVPTTTTLKPPNAKIVFGTMTHLVGLSNHVGGGLPWTSGWGKGVDFYSEKSVEAALLGLSAIPGTTFHFSLAGDLNSSVSSGRVDLPENLNRYSWSSTTTEYQIIMNNPVLRSITTFYDYKPGGGYFPTTPMSP